MKAALIQYRRLAEEIEWEEWRDVSVRTAYRPGDPIPYEVGAALRQRLEALGLSLDRARLARLVSLKALDLLGNPKHSIEKVLSRFFKNPREKQ